MKKIFVLITILGYSIDNNAMYILKPEENFIHTFFKKKRIEKNTAKINNMMPTNQYKISLDKQTADICNEADIWNESDLNTKGSLGNILVRKNTIDTLVEDILKKIPINLVNKKQNNVESMLYVSSIKRQPVTFLPFVKKSTKSSVAKNNVKFASNTIKNSQTKARPKIQPVTKELL